MNPEHLEVVKQGPEAITKWRCENPTGTLDLEDAHLSRAQLDGADLSGAKLSRTALRKAYLRNATLIDADLSEAKLYQTRLTGADLSGAKLYGTYIADADLREVNLTNADLSRAKLGYTSLFDANLSGSNLYQTELFGVDMTNVDLTNAQCDATIFADVDLSKVKGLKLVQHIGPSTIGLDTVYRSGNKIPEAFLRGCGVPEDFITYLPSLIGAQQAVQFYSCFISYSHKDEEFAQRLHGRLRDAGLRVWYAPEEMKGGRKLHEQIDEGIRLHDKLLLVLSEKSLASEWVATEIRKARKAERKEGRQKLFPIRLVPFAPHIKEWECFDADSGKDLGVELREYFMPDFQNWKDHDAFEAGMVRLLQDLRAEETGTTSPI